MTRDPDVLTGRRWDLLVIGGGIHGLFSAYDAAQRGLAVALVDAGDFGSGLSFNHQRTLHGGLRVLQSGSLRKVRQQARERRAWARIAPHLIRPLPFLMGTYRRLGRSRMALRAGFAVYERVARSRDTGVTTELRLPRTRLESAAATRRLFPGIAERGLSGGAVWYDYQTRHPDRLTWLVGLAAQRAGATLVNYTRAVAPVRGPGGGIGGARVRDELDGRERDVEASVTLLAPGSALGPLRQAFGAGEGPRLLRAINVLIDRPARDIALAAPGRSGLMLTAVPWAGAVLVGTGQSDVAVPVDQACPSPADVAAFLDDLAPAFPALRATPADVRFVHYGLTPAVVRRGRADLLPDPRIVRHRREGVPGLVSLIGVKYTTARWIAERAVDAVAGELAARPRTPCRTADAVLPHAGIADAEGRLTETCRAIEMSLDPDVAGHLVGWYGTEAPEVLRHAAQIGLLNRLDSTTPVLEGEVSYAVGQLSAVRLSDVVLRRTPLGSAGHPGRPALERAARLMGRLLGWSEGRMAQEIAAVEARYAIGRAPS
jgi:glycerol-3-phosphate dehydrogenase